MHRSAAGAQVALVACIGLTLAGCATQAPRPATSGLPEAAVAAPPGDRELSVPAGAPVADEPREAFEAAPDDGADAATTQSADTVVPPDVDPDLWSQIRDGFAIEVASERPRVRRWTQQYATHQRYLKTSLERARPFLWHIFQRIEERDLPTELALLPIIESGFDPTARSYMGASGLWQIMPGTADHVGLDRDWWYDGRNDVIASTDAALSYLDAMQARYDGDWLLALAAYNAGPGRVDAALARAERKGAGSSFWDLDLPSETMDYVPKLLALRRIMAGPQRFSMDWPTLDASPHTRMVTLPGQVELAVAAGMLDISEQDLRRLNPALQRWASAPRKGMRLLVPAEKADSLRNQLAKAGPDMLVQRSTYTVRRGDALGTIAQHHNISLAALRQANHLSHDLIQPGQTLQIPRSTNTPDRAPAVAEPSRSYIVQSGDSLWQIAQRYQVDVAAMRRRNPGIGRSLWPGQTLSIPGSASPPEPSTYLVQRGDSLSQIAASNDIAVADLRRWNRLEDNTPLQPGQSLAVDGPARLPDFYEVESGDSLGSIAARFSMRVKTLRSLNDMASGSTIQPGQRLRLQPVVSSSPNALANG